MNNPRSLALALALSSLAAACEPQEGGKLCDDIAFAAPSCALTCPWRRQTDCDNAQAEECIVRVESAYSSVVPATCAELQQIVSDVCAPRADCR